MIPWTVSQQFQDAEFPTLSGLRIVRIATHPDVARAGYGTRALSQLVNYYQGKIANLQEGDAEEAGYNPEATAATTTANDGLLDETLKVCSAPTVHTSTASAHVVLITLGVRHSGAPQLSCAQ
jgi:N-acetyltransferase 10